MIIVEIIHACANEIYHMQSKQWYWHIVTSSKRDINGAAVVMQINFTE